MTVDLHRVERDDDDGGTRMRLTGEVDAANAGAVEDDLRRVAATGATTVDLADLEFIDSAGLAVLDRLGSELGLIYIAEPGSFARRAVEIMRLPNVHLVLRDEAD
jgi:hypothetical protein